MKDDQELVALQLFRIQHLHFIAEIDVQVEAAAESLTERYSDVVAVVIAIADQGGHWILSCAKPLAGMERAKRRTRLSKAVRDCAILAFGYRVRHSAA
jgi:hypothetical protein